MNAKTPKISIPAAAVIGMSAVLYFFLAYYTPRENFILLVSLYAGAFACFLWLQIKIIDPKVLLFTGVFFRLLFLFSLPHFSQDFYRFIWDGRLLQHGINPYQYLPTELMVKAEFDIPQKELLFEKMGNLSATHFSNYPPANQLLFWLGAILGGTKLLGPVLLFKIIILLADIGIFIYGRKLLAFIGKPVNNILFYFLNPLVLVELSGNLHFEGVMVFFLVSGLYFFLKNKTLGASIFTGLSIAIKLLPLILLPFFIRATKPKKLIYLFAGTGATVLILFACFYSPQLLDHYGETISLWFTNFEFNASIYYVIRAIGFAVTGYNIIHWTGIVLPIISFLLIMLIALRKKMETPEMMITAMLLGLSVYLALSTTVHPWYIITPLALSVFTRFRYMVWWSFFIIFSYSAYRTPEVKENYILLCVEYFPVFIILFIELYRKKEKMNIENPVSAEAVGYS